MKKLIILFLFFILFTLKTTIGFASENFETSTNIEYKISDNGKTYVTSSILIKNLTSQFYPEKFNITISNLKPENITIFEDGDKIQPFYDERNPGKIFLNFNKKSAGVDKVKSVLITYETNEIAKKTGDVWEVQVPQILDEKEVYDNVNLRIIVPNSFGDEAVLDPHPENIIEDKDNKTYIFSSKKNTFKSGIKLSFGEFQYYSFQLNYHLSKNNGIEQEIPLPPDTSLQKVYIENINPKPQKVYIDQDGNWMARFNLTKSEKLDIIVNGKVKVFSSPIRYLSSPSKEYLDKMILPDEYWDITDTRINLIGKSLDTPYDIYKYVSEYLTYNSARVVPNSERLGSIKALESRENALCTEFTDLFIAIARSKGIPAREIQGYAITDNQEIMPLSLISDVLHSWVEFWDEEKQVWIPADPTWASTNRNVEYFNNLDMKHIAFVVHGTNSTSPLPPGFYKDFSSLNGQKDVFVTFANKDNNEAFYTEKLETDIKLKTAINPFYKKLTFTLKNTSEEAVYSKTIDMLINKEVVSSSVTLPPYGEFVHESSIYYGPFGMKAPKSLNFYLEGKKIDVDLKTDSHLFRDLIVVSILFSFVAFWTLIKIRTHLK